MANEVVIQVAGLTILAVGLIYGFIGFKKRRASRDSSMGLPLPRMEGERPKIVATGATPQPVAPVVAPVKVTTEPKRPAVSLTPSTPAAPVKPAAAVANVEAEKQPLVLQMQPLAAREDRNQRILADISSNIRKSMIKPVAPYSPLQYPEATRETEYVRVKKQIITPHGQVRFSILKDSISTNMPALFRRASQEWKTANDLIGFLPAYLEPEAEILEGQVLVVGTPGHPEKVAVPIRSVDANSSLRNCFEFVADARAAADTPAVLIASTDNELEVVSRGVITQPVFVNRAELKLLAENPVEAVHA
jgi:hypothetical protein